MFRLLKTILQDSGSWLLLMLLMVTVILGLTALFNRYDRLDNSKELLYRLEYDIWVMQTELEQKETG